MTLRDDIKTLDLAIPAEWTTVLNAWDRIKKHIPLPVQTTQEQFLEFPVGQKFTMPDDSRFTFIKVGENSMVRIRKEDGHARYYEDIFVGGFAHWTVQTYELKKVED